MKEYIERDAVLEAIKEPYERVYGKCVYQPVEDVYRMIVKKIKNTHAADVTPVVHGEWIKKEVEDFWIPSSLETGKPTKAILPVCSNCKTEFGTIAFEYDYCPHCGAKMDGVK